ncbi:putative ammonium transporter 1 [Mercenaria mercenaria]|uniref:putative ammonium transporter 1 n=1 Tax=Mercenaria mercenaria TaxID=6596 RepID=UPI001E1D8CFC|nr:putative ammonium transporter 1 [Mercenaria mercenaria]
MAEVTREFLSKLNESLVGLEESRATNADNMDQFFLIVMGFIIYLMQAGFAFLEAGAVRSKNTVNILIKNALDSFFGGVSYWLIGYALAFGKGNAFIGYTYFAHSGLPETMYAHWFFQFVFAATAATIVSGAVAERCDFTAYLVYSTLVTGFIYPVVTHWAWSEEGWLVNGDTYEIDGETVSIGYNDFAGSGVVHMVGGIIAFVGAWALGPRIGRFDKYTGKPVDIRGHSIPFASLGGFILVFGFFAFNGSSQGSISAEGDGAAIALAVVNTVLAASGGAFTTLILNKIKYFGDKKWSFLTTLNGCLTGMVAICAGCNQFQTYMGFITGILGGIAYMIFTWLVVKLKVDDPLDATAVHFGGGLVGVLTVPLFSSDYGIIYNWDKRSAYHLAWQLAGLCAIFAWSALLSFLTFFILMKARLLRVSFDYEMKGLDIPKHGETAYPAEAYGHGWGERGDTLSGLAKKAIASSTVTAISEDVSIKIEEKQHNGENPEVNAMRNKNGHANPAFTGSSTQL